MLTKHKHYITEHGIKMTLAEAIAYANAHELLNVPVRNSGGFIHSLPVEAEYEEKVQQAPVERVYSIRIELSGSDKFNSERLIFWHYSAPDGCAIKHSIDVTTGLGKLLPSLMVKGRRYNCNTGEFNGVWTAVPSKYGKLTRIWSLKGAYCYYYDYLTALDLLAELSE